ncbi:pantetheine-phosphate adenylyltransferase [Kallotenue papyrolyticum]|uniref:pantetheine-phosphate adenylyltransferase n=1 Tax=Kallotenue papyrolyticum TaxID=1325125 RepID=UPI00047856E4|nr:pantetheine-phosphate adenylyltransferase [Kallotenue papyrolyticum]
MTIAIYPASFDPITLGHMDVAARAAAIFDTVILAVYDRPLKNLLFSTEERVALVREAVAHLPNVRVDTYDELTVEYARRVGAKVIIRGLRAVTDFENELKMAHINNRLYPEIETVCLMASQEYSFLSSSAVKEIAALGGTVDFMVAPHVARALRRAYGWEERA